MVKEVWAIFIGTGVAIALFVVQELVKDMELWMTISGLTVSGLFVLLGIIGLVLHRKGESSPGQIISKSNAGRDIIQAGRDIDVKN